MCYNKIESIRHGLRVRAYNTFINNGLLPTIKIVETIVQIVPTILYFKPLVNIIIFNS